jgi:hypothetical protein
MKEIKATEGMYLTQSAEVGDSRIFVKAIKGANVNASDWREATVEEKDAWEKTREEKADFSELDEFLKQ